MSTPFDEFIDDIKKNRYHNHRLELHSDIVSRGILKDLRNSCDRLTEDLDSGKILYWMNVNAPGDRGRKIDLFIGEPAANDSSPDLEKVRIVIKTSRSSRLIGIGPIDLMISRKHSSQSMASRRRR